MSKEEDDRFNGFRLRTTFDDGVLITVVDLLNDNELRARIDHVRYHLQEQHLVSSLVQLGWTPPPEVVIDLEVDDD